MRACFQLSFLVLAGTLTLVGCGGATEGGAEERGDGIGQCAGCKDDATGPDGNTTSPADDPDDVDPLPGSTTPLNPATPASGAFAIYWRDTPGEFGSYQPDDLMLVLGNSPASCQSYNEIPACTATGQFKVWIPVVAEQLVAGSEVDLSTTNAYSSMTLPHYSPGDCGAGAGSFGGTLKVLAISETQVTVELSGTPTWDGDVNGVHQIPICPGA